VKPLHRLQKFFRDLIVFRVASATAPPIASRTRALKVIPI
jgi:hypothetical protein